MKSEKILKKYCRDDGTISLSFVNKKDLHYFEHLSVASHCDKHNISYSIVSDFITLNNKKSYEIVYGTVIAMQDFIVIKNELRLCEYKKNKKIKNDMLFKSKIQKSIDWCIKIYYPSLDVKVINRLKSYNFHNFKRSNTFQYIILYIKLSVEIYYSYLVANGWENLPTTTNSEFVAFQENLQPLRDELLEIWSLPGPTEIIDFIGCKSVTTVSVHLPVLTLKAKPHLRSERIKNTVYAALSSAGFSAIADDFSAKAENSEDLLLLASEYVQLTYRG